MQWNLQELNDWEELRPYVDTALFPLYFYEPERDLTQHVLRMTYLMNIASAIEQRLRGRMLLFPLSYQAGEGDRKYPLPDRFPIYFVLQFSGQNLRGIHETAEVYHLTVGNEDLDSAVRFEVTVDVLYQEILKLWSSSQSSSSFR